SPPPCFARHLPGAGRRLLPIHGEVAPVRATEGDAPSPPPCFARHLPGAGRSLLPIHGEVAPVRATEGVAPSPPPRFARHLPASGEESSKSAGDGFQVSRGAGCLVALDAEGG